MVLLAGMQSQERKKHECRNHIPSRWVKTELPNDKLHARQFEQRQVVCERDRVAT